MTLRSLLVSGLVAGLLAGLAVFAVASLAGEPPLSAAVALEDAGVPGHSHEADATAPHSHEDGPVSRTTQQTWGLLTASLGLAVVVGGLTGLVAAVALGRLGRLSGVQSTALVTAVGFVALGLVPWLKYPAAPPGVGGASTVEDRTVEYFVLLLVSSVAAVAALVLGRRLAASRGAYAGVVAGLAAYLLVVVVTSVLLPAPVAAGDFPADTLWEFRRAALLVQLALWGVLGVALVGLVGRLEQTDRTRAERRALAASL